SMSNAETLARQTAQETHLTPSQTANLVASYRLENSYAGRLGKFIEPTIKPLGYDWKIGIALLTSFAAREVFVGTMSTIYSLGEDADQQSLRQKISNYRNQDGQLVFTTATSFSLLIFYVFAMQCMSTLAVVKRETNSWKWPALQFFFMTGFAYLAALLVYQLMK
ncbi:MAG TPA: ferrous iron transporter B, partial [Saprospiraceae bacterium]|nr:ferrous iron transporter B [Saprospiraceae bacterium]